MSVGRQVNARQLSCRSDVTLAKRYKQCHTNTRQKWDKNTGCENRFRNTLNGVLILLNLRQGCQQGIEARGQGQGLSFQEQGKDQGLNVKGQAQGQGHEISRP